MSAMASQITRRTIVYSSVYSGADKRKHQKLRITGLCEGNSPVTGEFPTQRASDAENISIWWRHHGSNPFYRQNREYSDVFSDLELMMPWQHAISIQCGVNIPEIGTASYKNITAVCDVLVPCVGICLALARVDVVWSPMDVTKFNLIGWIRGRGHGFCHTKYILLPFSNRFNSWRTYFFRR